MARRVRMNGFADELSRLLTSISRDIDAAVVEASEKTSQDALEVLKTSGRYKDKTGGYRASLSIEKSAGSTGMPFVLHSKAPHYRVAHLLERGHRKKGGGKTKAHPHWKKAEEEADRKYASNLADAVRRGGGAE